MLARAQTSPYIQKNSQTQPAYTHTYTHTHSCISTLILTHTHNYYHTCSVIQTCTHSHTCTHIIQLHKPNLHPSAACLSRPAQAWPHLMAASCSLFPSWFYLFFLATVSIFGEGSIFTLSGNILPLGHELVRSVRRCLAAVAQAEAKPGWRPRAPEARQLPRIVWPSLRLRPLPLKFFLHNPELRMAPPHSGSCGWESGPPLCSFHMTGGWP